MPLPLLFVCHSYLVQCIACRLDYVVTQKRKVYLFGENLIQIEKEKRGVDPEKFMAYIRSGVVDHGMYYLLLDIAVRKKDKNTHESVLATAYGLIVSSPVRIVIKPKNELIIVK